MSGLTLSLFLLMGFQEGPDEPTRTEVLEAARQEKASDLKPPSRGPLERALNEFKERRVLERFQAGYKGLHPLLGGLRTGAGFGAGTSVEKDGFRVSAQVSIRGYQKYEVGYKLPIDSDLFFADLRATYRNFTQERYFGTGPDSKEQNQTSYRMEDINYVGRFGITPAKHIKAGVLSGWLGTSVGSGTSRFVPSIETVFSSPNTPALANQPDYAEVGLFFEADYRDHPGNPRAGGRYTASWTSFRDRNLGQYDFGRYDIEGQHYFPFFHQRRVIAVRAKTTMTQTATGQEVPFFMQPTVGGSEDLRGFNEFRFRDRNMVVLNAEYRWEAFSGLDLAAFVDAGQVAPRVSDFHLGNFEKSYGVGFRFNTEKSVFLRVDLGFSREGQRLLIKFGHVF